MTAVLVHFVAATAGALALSMLFARLSGAESFSAPLGVVFIGVTCAVMAHFLSPWATPAVLGVYLVGSIGELAQERRARRRTPEGP